MTTQITLNLDALNLYPVLETNNDLCQKLATNSNHLFRYLKLS